MKKILLSLVACTAYIYSQSADTAVFVAAMSPGNEVPAVMGYAASGTAVLYAHAMRNAQGQIVSGSVDFVIYHTFPDTPTVTGLHVHTGAAGVNGPVVINTGITGAANVMPPARGVIERQAQVLASDANAVAALREMFENPQGYYANLHTTAYPGGAIRGQLHRAERSVLIGRMLPGKEIPAITDFGASAVGVVEAVRAYDANSRFVAGAATFSVDYTVPEATTFTGLHIHTGSATVNGGVVINTGIAAGANAVESAASGSGNVTRRVEVPSGTPASGALDGLFDAPELFYINIHSTRFPGGVMRSQMSKSETIRIPVSMSPANEVPPVTGLEASAVGNFWINALRGADGNIVAAQVTFDLNHRFPADTRFTGLHIHDAKAGANGGVSINSGLAAFDSASGFGNIFKAAGVGGGQALTSLNSVVSSPENHYINLHTSANAGGAVRAQLGTENTRAPRVVEVISAVSDISARTLAPAGQFTIFGADLLRLASNLGGMEGNRAPTALNGTSVTIGGLVAPILYMGSDPRNTPADYIVALVPVNAPAAEHDVVVRTANGNSNAFKATVAAQAPALFFDAAGAIVVRADSLELVRPGSAARAGESLALLSTGLGQTTPALATGEIPVSANVVTQPVTLTVGGRTATVAGTTLVPGLPGFYVTLFMMPSNVTPGMAPVQLRVNNVPSNTVMLPAR